MMSISRLFLICFLFCTCAGKEQQKTKNDNGPAPTTEAGMVWIPGDEFTMGTDDQESYEHERPAHRVQVNGFWMDETEVTNHQFKLFTDATGYKTVAERVPSWSELSKQLPPGTPRPPDSLLVAGSLVFETPAAPVMLNDYSQWWKWSKGSNWQHPEGKESNLKARWDHPVVHIALEDAQAYCQWAGKRLPSEAEWELAARGGVEQQRYAWGNEFKSQGRLVANTFQGSFPTTNSNEDGFEGTAPVKSFPPNPYGLYDMIGNVWEWTRDLYHISYYSQLAKTTVSNNPQGPDHSYDPNEPYVVKHVTKGGSFLCASNYCSNYRPSARQGTAFDSGSSNIGFRCVKDKTP